MKNKQIIKKYYKEAYQGYNIFEGKAINIKSCSQGCVWNFPRKIAYNVFENSKGLNIIKL